MTIYQQEMLRRLPQLGCAGRMDENDETLYISYQKEALRSQYDYDSYWPDEDAKSLFREESRGLFQKAGWELRPGRNGACDTVTKGKQELYLYPMNFSGIIRMDEVPRIEKLLGGAKSFRCCGVDCYKEYFEEIVYEQEGSCPEQQTMRL